MSLPVTQPHRVCRKVGLIPSSLISSGFGSLKAEDSFSSAALAALAKSNKNYLIRSSAGSQFLFQIIALLVTLAIAIVGGAVIALIVRSAKHPGGKEFHVDHMYDDSGELH